MGKGTGLGLATVYGIVRQSRGHIRVDSGVDRGSTFTAYFPRIDAAADEDASHAPSHAPSRAAPPRGTETILLAEDEPTVRATLRRTLEQYGYRVLEARDGSEALHLHAAHAAEIEMVVTDAVMPDVGGLELRRRLLEARPGLPVLVMSGYSDALATGGADLGDQFLGKPFSVEALLARVRALLDRAKSAPAESGSA